MRWFKRVDIILITLGAALFYWIAESAIHAYFFSSSLPSGHSGSSLLIQSLFYPGKHELYSRLIVLLILGVLGLIIQRLLIRLRISHYRSHIAGLPNLRGFLTILESRIAHHQRYRSGFSIGIVKIRNIQMVTQSIGRSYGESILCQAAERFHELDPSITVGHLGGSSFIFLLENTCKLETTNFYQETLISIFSDPFSVMDLSFCVEFHAGIDCFPPTSSAQDLIVRAEKAVEWGSQRNELVCFYSSEHDTVPYAHLKMMEDLPKAIDRDEFIIYLQDKYDLRTKEVSGYEILARWLHPQNGILYPGDFILAAESSQVINAFSRYYVKKVLARLSEFAHKTSLPFSLNLSVNTLVHKATMEELKAIIFESDFPISQLVIEITESSFLANPHLAAQEVTELKNLGCQISIDDLGSGYSTLDYLQRFDFDEIKIDMSLISGIAYNFKKQILLKNIINFAHELDTVVCAEGIENKEDLRWAEGAGCDQGQGFLLHKPEPLEQILLRH